MTESQQLEFLKKMYKAAFELNKLLSSENIQLRLRVRRLERELLLRKKKKSRNLWNRIWGKG